MSGKRTVQTPGQPKPQDTPPELQDGNQEQSSDADTPEQPQDTPTTIGVDNELLLELIASNKRIEEKLDQVAAQAGVTLKAKAKRFKHVAGKGHVLE